MDFLSNLLSTHPIATVFLIIVLGALLGRITVFGISLGASGVLFVGLLFGYLIEFSADNLAMVEALGNFGVVLFVYAIGLQAGPRFLATVRSKGPAPLLIGLATVLGSAVLVSAVGLLLGLAPEMIVGTFAGALTSTPALAAATGAAGNPDAASQVSVAYGVAYPFGVVGVVLFAQLIPRLLARRKEETTRRADSAPTEPIIKRCFRVENPACIGRSLGSLNIHARVAANFSRIMRESRVLPYDGDLKLAHGDILLAVGTENELEHLALLLGPPVDVSLERDPSVVARDIFVTENAFAGKSLKQLRLLSRFGVVLTRIRRETLEFVPRGDFVLEVGDQVRAVGHESEVQAFAQTVGIREQRIHETGIAPFSAGLVLGLLLGLVPLPLPGTDAVRLGLAGGPLFVGLILGHFGRIGKLRVHVPSAGRFLMRELGLVLFLVYAGVAAGGKLGPILAAQGADLLILGGLTVLVGATIGGVLAYVVFKQTAASTVGLTCGAMTSTPGLGAASAQFDSDVPALAYAAVYPLALVLMTVVAQVMLTVLPRIAVLLE